jgi:hypothetical protein
MVSWYHCFWAHGEAEHHSGRAWWNSTVVLMAARKQRATDRKGSGSKTHPPSNPLSPTRPLFQQFHHLSIVYSSLNPAVH